MGTITYRNQPVEDLHCECWGQWATREEQMPYCMGYWGGLSPGPGESDTRMPKPSTMTWSWSAGSGTRVGACALDVRSRRTSAARDGPCAAWHISQARRVQSIADRRSEPAFVQWLADASVWQAAVASSSGVYTFHHEVFVCLSTVESGCSLGMRRAGGVCICCCASRSWYILVLYIGALHHGNCKSWTHRLVLLSHSPRSCSVCPHACHTCLGLWSQWCNLAQSM